MILLSISQYLPSKKLSKVLISVIFSIPNNFTLILCNKCHNLNFIIVLKLDLEYQKSFYYFEGKNCIFLIVDTFRKRIFKIQYKYYSHIIYKQPAWLLHSYAIVGLILRFV